MHAFFIDDARCWWLIPRLAGLLVGVAMSLTPQLSRAVDLFQELSELGLDLTQQQSVKLPPPTLRPEMDAAEREQALMQLAGNQEWSRFTRDSIMAPVAIHIDSIEDADAVRLGHLVHSAFMVYAQLDTLRDQQLMEQMFGRPTTAADSPSVITQELTADELKQLGLSADAANNETFAYLQMPLLNKVVIRGVLQIQKRERPGAVEFVWRLDPRFTEHEKYASTWTELVRNSVGRLEEGATHPYTGYAGWMGVYETDTDAKQQLLVESRMLLHEPPEWFAGSNFLRSKLPLSIQENARTFRRKLKP